MIKQLSDREHILKRPNMYIGGVDMTKVHDYVLDNNTINYKEISYVPGLVKIINEIIDNSLDVAIKTNFKNSNLITVKMTKDCVEIQDNGTGIPVIKNDDGQYLAELAWGHARAGSNFDDDDNRTQIGMNGVGSFSTNCFSKKFVGMTDDGKNRYTITFKNNASTFTDKVEKSSGKSGVTVKFWPELERFGLSEIDETHMNVVHQRLLNLSISFPEITFKFNGKKVNINSFKKYVSLFSKSAEIYETDDYRFAILPNSEDDFRHLSYVNGLKIPDGGTHVDIISGQVVNRIREKLSKKFKTIKPGDIKNKLMVISFLKNVKNTKFNSQSKEKITNSIAEINKYFGDIPYDSICAKILKNKEIIDPITEVYRIKEEFKKRQELKNLKKSTKKIKSDKYLPSIGPKKYLVLCEGQSARSGLEPILGRKEFGYFELRGVPLNAYSAPQSKFTANKELSELFKVIQNEDYEKIILANDADLDGCLRGDTLIPLLDGRKVKIKDLVNEEEFWVYSYDENGKFHPGRGHSARVTKSVDRLYRLTLSNGKTIEVTNEHPIMLRNGEFRPAEKIKVGDSLMPHKNIISKNNKPKNDFLFLVSNVEIIEIENEEVYDLTVDKYHNFATCSGAVVHNCHIAGLLVGFFERYMPEYRSRIGRFLTPVKFVSKNGVPIKWAYDLNVDLNVSSGETFKYVKGLGTWNPQDLKHIISKDGLQKMIQMLEFDSKEIIDDWLGGDSEPRKKYILKNDFSISTL